MGVLFLLFQRILNDAYHPVNIPHHIVIPKTNHLVSQRLKILCSFCVILGLVYMLASVQLNDEFLFDTAEIGDVVSNGMLSSEIHP